MNMFTKVLRLRRSQKLPVSFSVAGESRKVIRHRAARCLFEALEPRLMLSAAATFSGGMASLPISRQAALTSTAAATANAQTGYQLTVLASVSGSAGYFRGVNGTIADTSLTMESNGTLVGNNASAVFALAPGGQQTPLAFIDDTGDGPNALYLAGNGYFYGTTTNGGNYGSGTLFRITSSGAYTTLENFDPAAGTANAPVGGVVMDSSGNIYGAVNNVGYANQPGIFKYASNGTLTSDFSTIPGLPDGGLIIDGSGNLYGVTGSSEAGGVVVQNGGVYKVASNGAISTLFTFNGTDGSNPMGSLLRDSSGNLYGVTEYGGSSGYGTVFKLSSNGTLTTLVNFNGTNGTNPQAGLAMDSAGNLYGVTSSGGAYGDGTVYEISSGGTFSVLYNFSQFSAVFNPLGTPYISSNGNIYADASGGGTNVSGGIFELVPPAAVRPTITGVSMQPISGTNNWQMFISGNNFGSQSPYYGDSPYLSIVDPGVVAAANTGDAVVANVTSWTNTQIVISGLSGAYGSNGWVISPGNTVLFGVSNPQSGLAAATFSTTAPGTPAPVISGVFMQPTYPGSDNWQIFISGNNFGTQSAFYGDSPDISIVDPGVLAAGHTGDGASTNVTSWSNTQIVISGLSGAYGSNGWVISSGQSVLMDVVNPQTGRQSAVFSTTAPVVPVITAVSAQQISGTNNWQIFISGNNFGTQAAFWGDSPDLVIVDPGVVAAGHTGDAAYANVTSWSNTQIVISGLAGAYGTNGWVIAPGNNVLFQVANAQDGVSSAVFSKTFT